MPLARGAESSSTVDLGPVSEGRRTLGALAVLIPAWQPDARLVGVVRALIAAGFGRVIVVDDGSSAGCARVFANVRALQGASVLRHSFNRGKGRALKTGFEHVLSLGEGVTGVVTADADGQHTPEDIVRVGEALLNTPLPAVLGVRNFAGEVPLRSRLGNLLTRRMFSLLTGTTVSDTQTGLRGLRRGELPTLMALDGERYEYEMRVLAHLCRPGPPPLEVAVATVYLENNRGSHFKPFRDSLRIYGVLLRFAILRPAEPSPVADLVGADGEGGRDCDRWPPPSAGDRLDRPAFHFPH